MKLTIKQNTETTTITSTFDIPTLSMSRTFPAADLSNIRDFFLLDAYP